MSEEPQPFLGIVDPDYLQAHEAKIGQIATVFSLIHTILERFAWSLWGLTEEFGSILTKDLPIKGLTEKILATLAEIHVEDQTAKRIKTLLKEVNTLAIQRNALMHSMWNFKTNPPTLVGRKKPVSGKPDFSSIEEMTNLVDRMETVAEQLYVFTTENRLLGALGLATKRKYSRNPEK